MKWGGREEQRGLKDGGGQLKESSKRFGFVGKHKKQPTAGSTVGVL